MQPRLVNNMVTGLNGNGIWDVFQPVKTYSQSRLKPMLCIKVVFKMSGCAIANPTLRLMYHLCSCLSSASLVPMFRQLIANIRHIKTHIGAPFPKTTVLINSLHPLVQMLPLYLVLF
jgi:hypothetical protein